MDQQTILLLISVFLFIVACCLALKSKAEGYQAFPGSSFAGASASSQTKPCTLVDANYPPTPTITNVIVTSEGIEVAFNKVDAIPELNGYIVSAGQGNASLFVPITTTKVVIPVLPGQKDAAISVQSVNNYGISLPGFYTKKLTQADLSPATPDPNIKVIQVLQLSDFHGAIETTPSLPGIALLDSAWNQDRQIVPTTFTFSSGDNFGASPPISSQFQEIPTILGMNELEFDASTFGNHEHDRNLQHLRQMIDLSDFNWVVSNYNTLAPLSTEKKPVAPFTIVSRNGFNIGVVGGNTYDTPVLVAPTNLNYKDRDGSTKTITISKGVKEINDNIVAAKAQGADIVVVLLHQGHLNSVGGCINGPLFDLSSKIKGAAAVFGGHTHQVYNTVLPNGTFIAQTFSSGLVYNRLNLTYDLKNKKVIGGFLETVGAEKLMKLTPSKAAADIVTYYKDLNASKFDERIGKVAGVFPRGGSPPVERSGETPMGNLIADLMRQRAGTQLAITNGGGIRDTFPAKAYSPKDKTLKRPAAGVNPPYDVVIGDAVSVFPFGNSLYKTSISGWQLWNLLENGVSSFPAHGKFPQISGFKFSFDSTKPANSRIVSVTLDNGVPVKKDSSTFYTIATNDFMFNGGDAYNMNDWNREKSEFIGDLLLDLLINKVKADAAAGKPTTVTPMTGRIVKVK